MNPDLYGNDGIMFFVLDLDRFSGELRHDGRASDDSADRQAGRCHLAM